MSQPQARHWRTSGFLQQLLEDDQNRPDRRFAFILGAGASVSSGIKAAGALVNQWLNELHVRECMSNHTVSQWATEESLGIVGFEYEKRTAFYSHIFERRYNRDRSEGYVALEKLMDGANPGFGYALLSQILTKSRHNVVITTNFDNLIAQLTSCSLG